jgi:hypothetical protein
MSSQYREHGRRKQHPLPPSSFDRPWVLVRNKGQLVNQVTYLIRERENDYVGVLLCFDFIHGWELAEEPARFIFVSKADVLHVFVHEPARLQDIHEAWLKLKDRP